MRKIPTQNIKGIRIAQVENKAATTGCTVFICEDGMPAGLNVRVADNKFIGNTTLAVVMTNAAFTKPQLCKIAGMAHDGLARAKDLEGGSV